MKKKTLNIILASTLLTSAIAVSFPIIYISAKNSNNNTNSDSNSETKPPVEDNNPNIPPSEDKNPDNNVSPPSDNNKPNVPSDPDNNVSPPNDNNKPNIPNNPDDNIIPPVKPEEDNKIYVNELDNIVNNNKTINLKASSKLKQKQSSSIVNSDLKLSEMDNQTSFNSNILDVNQIYFHIINSNDSNGSLTAKLKYNNYISNNYVTINGFYKKSSSNQQDRLMAQRIFESNRTVDISGYKNVSKTIPMFFKNEAEREKLKKDGLKTYIHLPDGADWNKVNFIVNSYKNNNGILEMLVEYNGQTYNEPINFTGFAKANEWLDNLITLNSKHNISLKNLNKLKPSSFINSEEKQISIDDLSNFISKENVPDVTHYRQDAFVIIPTSETNDDKGSLKAKIQLWFDSSTKIESERTITIDNFERTVSVAESFAKLNPEINILELMKNKDVPVYDQNYNFLTQMKNIMASQYDIVEEKINSAIFEIPWKLKDKDIDISQSVVIDKKSNDISQVFNFPKNIYFDIVNGSADDRYGTVEIYVKTKYVDGTFSTLKNSTNKIKIKGLIDYSLIGINFINYNETLYIDKKSEFYTKKPSEVNISDIKLIKESVSDGDIEEYVILEQWIPMIPKLKLVPAKDEKGNLLVSSKKDRLLAQVQIDGIDIKYPTSYRYIEVIWPNADENEN